MSKEMTTPIPLVSAEDAALTQQRLGTLSGSPAAHGRMDTGAEGAGEGRVASATAHGRDLVGAQTVRLLIARLRAQTEDALSLPMPLVEVQPESPVGTNGEASRQELPVADFIEPVEYVWTEAGYEARRALKRCSEESHADY